MAESGQRVALVVGVGGLGSAIARRLARDGFAVACADARAEAADEVSAQIGAAGGQASAHTVEVTDQTSVEALIAAVLAAWGVLDVVIYAVGISPRRPWGAPRLGDTDRAEWERVLAVNLTGAFLLTKAAADALVQRHGCVVYLASGQGRMPAGNNTSGAHYVASKAGLIGLTKALAGELAPQGVRVNAVAPGFVPTPLTANMPPDSVARVRASIPLGRTATPEDIAGAVAFLVSPDAAFITGATLDVNGGRLMV
ncbi:MAG: SDR family oxidoreductase [Chloroflexi bacterium]|nr:SDR family oxidoreductase [Chloroflexota bacterium]